MPKPSASDRGTDASLLEKFKAAADTALLQYLSDSKDRKPN